MKKSIIVFVILFTGCFTVSSQIDNMISRLVKSNVFDPHLNSVKTIAAHNSIYVAGNFDNLFYYEEGKAMSPSGARSMFIIKYDENLVFQNRVVINAYCYDLSFNENSVLVSGSFKDSCMIGDSVIYSTGTSNDLSVFYASLSPDLETVNWMNQILFKKDGTEIYFRTCKLRADSDNNLYVGGIFEDSLQIGDTVIYSERYLGTYISESFFIAKYNNNNEFIWARVIFGDRVSYTVDGDNNIFAVSASSDPYKFSLIKLDSDGNQVFAKHIVNEYGFYSNEIQCDGENNVIISLAVPKDAKIDTVDITRIGIRDNVILKYSPDGDLIWLKQIGTTGSDFFPGIVKLDSHNNIISMNDYYGNLSIDDNVFPASKRSFYIFKMKSDGELDWFEKSVNANGGDDAISLSVSGETVFYIFLADYQTSFLATQVSPTFDSEYYLGKLKGTNKNLVSSEISEYGSTDTNSKWKIYPNPASSSIRIAFTLDESIDTRVLLYNSLGQLVKIIYDGILSPDTYEIESDISELKGGLYYISYQNKDLINTQKLFVID